MLEVRALKADERPRTQESQQEKGKKEQKEKREKTEKKEKGEKEDVAAAVGEPPAARQSVAAYIDDLAESFCQGRFAEEVSDVRGRSSSHDGSHSNSGGSDACGSNSGHSSSRREQRWQQ